MTTAQPVPVARPQGNPAAPGTHTPPGIRHPRPATARPAGTTTPTPRRGDA